jgi:hypothetical protein
VDRLLDRRAALHVDVNAALQMRLVERDEGQCRRLLAALVQACERAQRLANRLGMRACEGVGQRFNSKAGRKILRLRQRRGVVAVR